MNQYLEHCYPNINKAAGKIMDLLAEEGLLICEAREVLREVEQPAGISQIAAASKTRCRAYLPAGLSRCIFDFDRARACA
ncbi:MAG: hypothetical protein C4570_03890 [Ammonifex sp.]|nr:MAG: hypothetical protein C4570_03890 [Ammonifex sp.]